MFKVGMIFVNSGVAKEAQFCTHEMPQLGACCGKQHNFGICQLERCSAAAVCGAQRLPQDWHCQASLPVTLLERHSHLQMCSCTKSQSASFVLSRVQCSLHVNLSTPHALQERARTCAAQHCSDHSMFPEALLNAVQQQLLASHDVIRPRITSSGLIGALIQLFRVIYMSSPQSLIQLL